MGLLNESTLESVGSGCGDSSLTTYIMQGPVRRVCAGKLTLTKDRADAQSLWQTTHSGALVLWCSGTVFVGLAHTRGFEMTATRLEPRPARKAGETKGEKRKLTRDFSTPMTSLMCHKNCAAIRQSVRTLQARRHR